VSFESVLATLVDPEKRPTAQELVDFSDLDDAELRALSDAWADLAPDRRLRLLTDLTDLSQDNVELNFDAIFRNALTDEEPEARVAALRGLYEYEGRDLIPPLAELLRDDPAPEVRREAAVALGRYALAAELGYLRSDDTDRIKGVLIESAEDLEEDERVRARAIEALGAISGEDTENLIESIYQEEESLWLKVGAVDAMGRSCNDNWLPLIIQEMENPAPEMRHAAAFAAGEIGEEDAIEPLKRMAIEDPDREVKLVAVHALSEIGGPLARVALKSVLYEGDDELQQAVQEAMTEVSFQEDPLNPSSF
jgi:HEAT repeat protein